MVISINVMTREAIRLFGLQHRAVSSTRSGAKLSEVKQHYTSFTLGPNLWDKPYAAMRHKSLDAFSEIIIQPMVRNLFVTLPRNALLVQQPIPLSKDAESTCDSFDGISMFGSIIKNPDQTEVLYLAMLYVLVE